MQAANVAKDIIPCRTTIKLYEANTSTAFTSFFVIYEQALVPSMWRYFVGVFEKINTTTETVPNNKVIPRRNQLIL